MSIATSMRTVQLETENRELRMVIHTMRHLIHMAYCQGCAEQFEEDHPEDERIVAHDDELYHAKCVPSERQT